MIRYFIWLFLFTSLGSTAFSLTLTIQQVVQKIQTTSLLQKDIEFASEKGELSLLSYEAEFDTQMYLKGQTEDSKLESPGAFSNRRDQTQQLSWGLNRKFNTGSFLGIDYSYMYRNSELGDTAAQLGLPPSLSYHLTTLTFKQDLLNNTFGYKDRKRADAAQWQYERSQIEKKEASEELIVQAVRLFLDTYVAQENLKQSIAARDKYQVLLKLNQQKNKMGFDDRSELIKTKAELRNQERNIKSASLAYSNLSQRLLTTLNMESNQVLAIDLSEKIQAPEQSKLMSSSEELRRQKSIDLLVKATESEKDASLNNEHSNLNFFAQAASSGLDPSSPEAFKEMNKGDHPKVTLGLEYTLRWGSSAQKAEALSKRVAYEEALNAQAKIRNELNETMQRTDRNLQVKYNISINALETAQIWEEAIKSQEKNHRFGRISSTELIMDYGSYFRAKSALSGAIADYTLAQFEFEAARDELTK